MKSATLYLHEPMFGPVEQTLLDFDGMRALGFRYPTGVAALRLCTGIDGDGIVVLPFRGQQVWDATLLGRRLTMGSPFAVPKDTDDYLASYGAFMLHCGVAAMGNPGADDTHPLHGELPLATLEGASLTVGEDPNGQFMDLAGWTQQSRAFHHDYTAALTLRLRARATAIETRIEVANHAPRPLDLMYLTHVNFRPIGGAELVDAVPDRAFVLRPMVGDAELPQDSYRTQVLHDPSLHRHIVADGRVEPELVFTLRMPADAQGWAHAMQKHPDGSADFVSHRPEELPCAVRWIARDGSMDALGLSLPSTGAPNGLSAGRARGETVAVPAGGTWRATVRVGAMPRTEADGLVAKVMAQRAAADGAGA